MLEPVPPIGITAAARATKRSTNFSDLDGRRRSGLLRGLMFLHMKAGLDADVIHLRFSQETYQLEHTPLTPSGVRREFQKALAELRTDLDAFTPDESSALMACGYQMASKALDSELPERADAWRGPRHGDWPFKDMLEEITSLKRGTDRRGAVLTGLWDGKKVKV
jgi:hypothetical protein